jgi:hypothetical protein
MGRVLNVSGEEMQFLSKLAEDRKRKVGGRIFGTSVFMPQEKAEAMAQNPRPG